MSGVKMSTEAVEWSSNESALGRVLAGMHRSWIRFCSEWRPCFGSKHVLWHSPCRICIIYIHIYIYTEIINHAYTHIYIYICVCVCVINILMFLLIAFKWLDSLRREFTACSVAEGIAVVFCSQDAQCHSIDSMCNSKIGRAWSMLFVQLGRWLRAVCRVWPRTSHGRHISRLLATIFTSAASHSKCQELRCRVRRWWKIWKDLGSELKNLLSWRLEALRCYLALKWGAKDRMFTTCEPQKTFTNGIPLLRQCQIDGP